MKSTVKSNCRLSDPEPLVINALNQGMKLIRLFGCTWLVYSEHKKFILEITDSQVIEMMKRDVLVEDNNQYGKITLGPKYIMK